MNLLANRGAINVLLAASVMLLVACGAETDFNDSQANPSNDGLNADSPPDRPTQLRGSRQGNLISLIWSDNSDNESDFLVEVMSEGGVWEEVTETDRDATFTHITVASEATLYVRVSARNSAGASNFSNIIKLENVIEPDDELITQGAVLWVEKACQGCHKGVDEVADYSVKAALSSNTFIHETTNTMPPGNIGSCDESCAEAIAAWLGTVYSEEEGEDEDVVVIEEPSVPASEAVLLKKLHKVSHSLAHVEPSQEWINLVKAEGEAGLEKAVREILEYPGFYWRIRDIYSPVLQSHIIPSNRYAKMIGGRAAWYNDLPPEQIHDAGATRWAIWDAVNNEPSRLVEFVVKNNLPFTEILTAEYTLVNYFSARAYNVLNQVSFTETLTPTVGSFPYDAREYKKAYLPFPGSGILTSSVFMTLYPTTDGNMNRHRAYNVFKMFLDTDILDLPGSRVEADDITVDNPTMENPTCTGCHNVMDPVAATFRHWSDPEERRYGDWRFARWNQNIILPPGFNGELMPEDNVGAVQWLGKKIAEDPRFAMSTVKTFFTEITGHELLPVPSEDDSANTKAFYEYQQKQLKIFADDFIQSGYLLKDLIVDFVLSDFYSNEAYLGGTSRLINSIQLDRKVRSALGVDWYGVSNDLINRFYRGNQPSGIMALMQQMAGSEVACYAVPADYYKPIEDRRLLPFFVDGPVLDEDGNVISSEKETEIKKNLRNLMWVIWGDSVALDSPALLSLYDLYLEIIPIGLQGNIDRGTSEYDFYCDRFHQMRGHDDHYALRAWMAVVNLMVDDHRFLYN